MRRARPRHERRVESRLLGRGLPCARARPGAQQSLDARRRAQRPLRQPRRLEPQVLQGRSRDDPAAQRPERQRVGCSHGRHGGDRRRLPARQHPGDLAAQPGPDDDRSLVPERPYDGGQVGGQGHQVVARRRPVRTAEAAQVHGGDAMARIRQGPDDVAPRPPALGEAVNEKNHRLGGGRVEARFDGRDGTALGRPAGTGVAIGPGAGERLLGPGESHMESSPTGREVAVGPRAGKGDGDGHQCSLPGGGSPGAPTGSDRPVGGAGRRAPLGPAFRAVGAAPSPEPVDSRLRPAFEAELTCGSGAFRSTRCRSRPLRPRRSPHS